MKKILVVGGAGYIGSHMVKALLKEGFDVCVFDNLSSGYQDAVVGGRFVQGDLCDIGALDQLFNEFLPEAVLHFASSIQVGESVRRPDLYFQNNVSNTLNLLNTMVKFKVNKFIFSSTAAIFGEPSYTPIDEQHPKVPLNPYGRSKYFVEEILKDYDVAFGLKSVCLRYFNAAGADPEGQLGERHEPETHLIPLVLQVASGRRESIHVFGNDYPTKDGTCVRDYIHIVDLCSAHSLALKHLLADGDSRRYNLGNGTGFTVQEVIKTVESVTARKINVTMSARRDGDPAVLIADSKQIMSDWGWQPAYDKLDEIVQHAWQWEQKHFTIKN